MHFVLDHFLKEQLLPLELIFPLLVTELSNPVVIEQYLFDTQLVLARSELL